VSVSAKQIFLLRIFKLALLARLLAPISLRSHPSCGAATASRRHVDSQEEPGGGLQVSLQGGRLVRQEGLQCPQAPRDRCAQPAGHQAHAELQVQGVRQGELRMEALLLVSLSVLTSMG
jgi:hypothetical protein